MIICLDYDLPYALVINGSFIPFLLVLVAANVMKLYFVDISHHFISTKISILYFSTNTAFEMKLYTAVPLTDAEIETTTLRYNGVQPMDRHAITYY